MFKRWAEDFLFFFVVPILGLITVWAACWFCRLFAYPLGPLKILFAVILLLIVGASSKNLSIMMITAAAMGAVILVASVLSGFLAWIQWVIMFFATSWWAWTALFFVALYLGMPKKRALEAKQEG